MTFSSMLFTGLFGLVVYHTVKLVGIRKLTPGTCTVTKNVATTTYQLAEDALKGIYWASTTENCALPKAILNASYGLSYMCYQVITSKVTYQAVTIACKAAYRVVTSKNTCWAVGKAFTGIRWTLTTKDYAVPKAITEAVLWLGYKIVTCTRAFVQELLVPMSTIQYPGGATGPAILAVPFTPQPGSKTAPTVVQDNTTNPPQSPLPQTDLEMVLWYWLIGAMLSAYILAQAMPIFSIFV